MIQLFKKSVLCYDQLREERMWMLNENVLYFFKVPIKSVSTQTIKRA